MSKTEAILGAGAILVIIPTLTYLLSAPNAAFSFSQKNSSIDASDAAALFEKHCATCHGKDGRAGTFKAKFNHAQNFTDKKWQAEVTDERIFNSISNGKGHMPAWGKKLSEADINGLVAYVRHFGK